MEPRYAPGTAILLPMRHLYRQVDALNSQMCPYAFSIIQANQVVSLPAAGHSDCNSVTGPVQWHLYPSCFSGSATASVEHGVVCCICCREHRQCRVDWCGAEGCAVQGR
jgi:hypothetical protein